MNIHLLELESQLFFSWIDDLELRNQLTIRVKAAKAKNYQEFLKGNESFY